MKKLYIRPKLRITNTYTVMFIAASPGSASGEVGDNTGHETGGEIDPKNPPTPESVKGFYAEYNSEW